MFRRLAIFAAVLAIFAAPALSPLTAPTAVEAQGASVTHATPGGFTPGDSSSVRPMGAQDVATATPTQARLSVNGGGNPCFVFDGKQTDPITGGCRLNDPGVNHSGPVPDGYYAFQGTNNCTFTGTVSGGVISFYFNGDPQTQARCGTTPNWTPTPTMTATPTATLPPQETRDGNCPLFGWAATHPLNDGGCKLNKAIPVTGTVDMSWFALSGAGPQRYEAGQTFTATQASFYKIPGSGGTATPTMSPTPASTYTPPKCSNQEFSISYEKLSPGKLKVTAQAKTGHYLGAWRFKSAQNAQVVFTLSGMTVPVDNQWHYPSAGSTGISFIVTRVAAGPVMVKYTLADSSTPGGCDWETFVGSGGSGSF